MTTHTPFGILRHAKNLVPTAAFAALLTATTAQAQVTAITITQFSALNPINAPITGPNSQPFTTYPISVSTPNGTETLTLSNGAPAANKSLLRRDQQGGVTPGANFGGDFATDTMLIANTVGTTTTGSGDGLRIDFSAPVSAFGFNFDPDLFLAPTDFTVVVSEGLTDTTFTSLTSSSLAGVVNRAQHNNTAPFFGIQDAGGNLITSVLIFGTAATNPAPVPPRQLNTRPNDFAVGVLRFNVTATVPEPGNVALLAGMVVTGAGCLARRKRATLSK